MADKCLPVKKRPLPPPSPVNTQTVSPQINNMLPKTTEACFLCNTRQTGQNSGQINNCKCLQDICRYLKTTPSSLFRKCTALGTRDEFYAAEDGSEFLVALCEKCASIANTFSNLIRQMDQLQHSLTNQQVIFLRLLAEPKQIHHKGALEELPSTVHLRDDERNEAEFTLETRSDGGVLGRGTDIYPCPSSLESNRETCTLPHGMHSLVPTHSNSVAAIPEKSHPKGHCSTESTKCNVLFAKRGQYKEASPLVHRISKANIRTSELSQGKRKSPGDKDKKRKSPGDKKKRQSHKKKATQSRQNKQIHHCLICEKSSHAQPYSNKSISTVYAHLTGRHPQIYFQHLKEKLPEDTNNCFDDYCKRFTKSLATHALQKSVSKKPRTSCWICSMNVCNSHNLRYHLIFAHHHILQDKLLEFIQKCSGARRTMVDQRI